MREIASRTARVGGLLFDVGGANLEKAALRKRRSPRQTLEDHAPQGVDVARGGRRLTLHKLRRHVIEGPQSLPGPGQSGIGPPFSEAEIGEQGTACRIDQDVGGLDVAMYEAGIVEGIETRAEAGGKTHYVAESLGAVGPCDICERSRLDISHHEVAEVILPARSENRNEMLVTHFGRGTRLVLESPPEDLVPNKLSFKGLQGNLGTISIADGPVDDARGPLSEHLFEPVSAYPLPLTHNAPGIPFHGPYLRWEALGSEVMERTPLEVVHCVFCGEASALEARFCWSCGRSLGTGEEHLASPSLPVAPDGGDEMRPLTALFADIVGSTRLGEHLAPDEVKSLVGECVGRMSRAVEEFGGTVQAYMGDGICAYFGVPLAHGDDAERAGRAALRIVQAIEDQRRDIEAAWGVPELNVRVGINSGPAAVGFVGGAAPQQVALGDATNIAARLQASAHPGTIALGPVTARQLAERFVVEPLGALQLKGREGQIFAWRLVGLRSISSPRPSSPFVGRESEVARVTHLSDGLRAGRGQILLITAAAGMGKTRLLGEFEGAVGEDIAWLQGHCLPYEGELPYGPFVEILREWLRVGTSEPEISVRTKLRARMRELSSSESSRWIGFLSRLLGVKVEAELEEQMTGLSPEELATEIRRAYLEWIEAFTELSPTVLALEDLHHADAITCSLAEDLVSLTDTAPLCVAATMEAKPSSQGWLLRLRLLTDYPHRTTELAVAPLSDETAIQLVDLLTPAGTLEPGLRTEIVDRAEGNPFFLKEILRAVIEGGGAARESTWTVSAELPPALESLLMARIDRLPPQARRAAQIAAVIGHDFSARLLQSLAGVADLRHEIATLLRAEIVRELRRYPTLEYSFTSSLLHEAVLSTMTPARLKALYGRVGALLEEDSENLSEDSLGLLAFYYYRSDQQEKALRYLELAAKQAELLDAHAHASELWKRALKAAQRVGDGDSARRIEATLLRSK